jgi:DNA-binding response OmpR family regulator
VRELTALHAGTVEATSEVGVGSRFCVRLPWRTVDGAEVDGSLVERTPAGPVRSAAVAEATAWTEPVTAPPSSAPAGAARVLVADDNADMRAHLVRLLRDQGWAVEAVADGQAALASALREPPDLLLTDVMMPGLDGFELVRALRADPRTATLPVVVLSARAGEGASAEGLDVGADDYVVKPFVSSDLVARLRGTLRLARQRSAHVQQLGVLADAVALITSGRRLDDALRTVPEQVRVLLGARGVRVRVVGADAADELAYSAGLPDVPTGEDPRESEVLEVPVRGRRDRELGSLTVRLPVAQAMRPETRALLAPLSRVLAAVVEEGWHAQRDVTLAATLQAFLLPERLPELAGLELAAAYRPAEQEVQVGGDWYDVLPLPDGRVAISTGDVAGQGLTSALVMGQLRTAVRAYALEGRSPAEAVTALDDLVDRLPGASFATLFLGYLDVGTGVLTWCSAGHPPPALLPDDGPAHWIEGEVTPPLGAGSGLPPSSTSTPVPAGARLVLYTDGLVEDRQGQLDDGMPALLRRLDASRERDAAGLVTAVLDGSPTQRADDTAVLVVHRRRPDGPQRTTLQDVSAQVTVPSTPQAASLVRRRLAPLLRQAGVDDDVAVLAAGGPVRGREQRGRARRRPRPPGGGRHAAGARRRADRPGRRAGLRALARAPPQHGPRPRRDPHAGGRAGAGAPRRRRHAGHPHPPAVRRCGGPSAVAISRACVRRVIATSGRARRTRPGSGDLPSVRPPVDRHIRSSPPEEPPAVAISPACARPVIATSGRARRTNPQQWRSPQRAPAR